MALIKLRKAHSKLFIKQFIINDISSKIFSATGIFKMENIWFINKIIHIDHLRNKNVNDGQ